ncbi:hypothetical protein B7463_g11533, partial [Scytalidium lignicola]
MLTQVDFDTTNLLPKNFDEDETTFPATKEVIPPKGTNLVSCKWVYTIKTNVDGIIKRFKARLIARGFSQVYREDYLETFAPTVKMDTLRLFLAIVTAENLKYYQFDIKNTFTESHLKEKIYLVTPPRVPVKRGYTLHTLQSLYSLNVSLLVYVDDIITAAKSQHQINQFFQQLSRRFNAKNLREIGKILSTRVTHDKKNRSIEIDQEQYLTIVLNRFGITARKHKTKKIPTADYESLQPATDDDTHINVKEYQQGIKSILFAMIFTRPDIAFVIGKLSQFISNPVEHHGHTLKNLMWYLRSTIKLRLQYNPGRVYKHFVIYSDADWANDKHNHKSISRSIMMFYNRPISWSSKKQKSVTTSSCKSEYMALSTCTKQGQWVAQIFQDLKRPNYIKENANLVQMLGDNQEAIALTKNPHLHKRSKHINICYHYIRNLGEKGRLHIDFVPTTEMIANGFTKPLQQVAFERFKNQIGLSDRPLSN